MSVESTIDRFKNSQVSLGKRAFNALYPNDVELYVFALEVVNSNNETEDYFVFPINPSSLNEQNSPIQTIKKTAGGITVLSTTTFTPSDISIQGNFGRNFKFLLGKEFISFSALNFTTKPNITFSQEFDAKVKSGYGCIKLLEGIIKKSNTLDGNNKPYALFFYNLALGNSYLIKAINFSFYQNQETNLIWNYNFTIKSLLPIEDVIDKTQKSLTQTLSANAAIQDLVNNVSSHIDRIITPGGIKSTFDNTKNSLHYQYSELRNKFGSLSDSTVNKRRV